MCTSLAAVAAVAAGSSATATTAGAGNGNGALGAADVGARPGERRAQVVVPQVERGSHIVTFVEPPGVPVGRRYALVSKSGGYPTLTDGSFHWVFTCPAEEVEGANSTPSTVAVVIESGCWEFESDIAFITYGVLADGEPEPRLPDGVGEFCGITFELQPQSLQQDGEDAGRDSVTFVPERSELDPRSQEAYQRYYQVFAHIDGHELSYRAQQRFPQTSTALTYGEAHFLPTLRLLRLLGVADGDVLVDLGSGTGRLLFAAALAFPYMQRCWGIELIKELHVAAQRARDQLVATGHACAPVDLTCGDFTEQDWSDATIAFAMSLCFPEDLLATLERQAMALKPGARLVVMHCCFGDVFQAAAACFQPLRLRDEHPRHAIPTEMSFGETPLYVFERLPDAQSGPTRLNELD